jgi:hypothetical protein
MESPSNNGEKGPWSVPLWNLQRITAILAGAFSIYLGYKLFILGVTGQASLSIESKTLSAQLLNASPGLFFALGGMTIIVVVVWRK